MKKRTGREFFEVFRRKPEAEKSAAWWAAHSPKKDKPVEIKKRAKVARDATTPPGRLKLTFSNEALVVAGLAVLVALVLSHVWGYRRGITRRMDVASYDAPAEESPTTTVPMRAMETARGAGRADTRTLATVTPPATGTFYTLRIINGIPAQNAQAIAADLKTRGYAHAFSSKEGGWYAVNVGRFENMSAAAGSGLKEKFSKMDYNNKDWFKDCYYQKVTVSGSHD